MMNRIQIITLAAMLAGCAAAPQPLVDAENETRAQTVAASVASVGEVTDQSELSSNTFAPPEQPVVTIPRALPRMPVDSQQQECLAQALYWEARGEGEDGMLAVASVVLNRVADERFPDTVCGVIYDGGETPPCQFSWWCDGKSDHPTNHAKWSEINNLANDFLATRPDDPTDGALFYHANTIQRPWRRQLTAQIGNHIFYR